ncbi:hypothetical protein BS78_03G247200 [Paspalum vaginatum]|nr:hypothetical protein BS78_03G247200 [Paspalum vaginatum]
MHPPSTLAWFRMFPCVQPLRRRPSSCQPVLYAIPVLRAAVLPACPRHLPAPCRPPFAIELLHRPLSSHYNFSPDFLLVFDSSYPAADLLHIGLLTSGEPLCTASLIQFGAADSAYTRICANPAC